MIVLGCDGKWVEVQICICEMYEVVEIGVVVYWFYKNGECVENCFVVDLFMWILQLIEWLDDEYDYDEFFEVVKFEMYQD